MGEKPTGDAFTEYAARPFLPADKLRAVSGDIQRDVLTPARLRIWYRAAQAVQQNLGCNALSFNQLDSELQNELGFGGTIPPSLIYLGKRYKSNPLLFINPRIEVPARPLYKPEIEACGSIKDGTVAYVIERPEAYSFRALAYDGDQLTSVNQGVEAFLGNEYKLLVHEHDHLRGGQTAQDRANLLWDLTKADKWSEFKRRFDVDGTGWGARTLMKMASGGILVPGEKGESKIVDVSEIGKY